MSALKLLHGERKSDVSRERQKLRAMLVSLWANEVDLSLDLAVLGKKNKQLAIHAAFSRAHASRLLAHLVAMGRGPMVALNYDEREVDEEEVLTRLINHVMKCREVAEVARSLCDDSVSHVCELNAVENADTINALRNHS